VDTREFGRILDGYFNGNGVPGPLASRRCEAYGHAELMVARVHLLSGRPLAAVGTIRAAAAHHPALVPPGALLSEVARTISSRLVIAANRFAH